MRLKSFDDFEKHRSGDPSNFIGQVGMATFNKSSHPYYSIISKQSQLVENQYDFPIILDSGFNVSIQAINENSSLVYNSTESPSNSDLLRKLSGFKYSPKTSNSIRDIKKGFRFPIVASNDSGSQEYKTIGKLRNSGTNYSKFTENPTAKTRFRILSFKGNPISIIERINRFESDIDLKYFDHMNESIEICKKIDEVFNLDLCNIEVIESVKGDILIKSVNTDLNLNPLQEARVYEAVYEDFYECRLPNFVKDKIFEENVKPYCEKMDLNLKLIKSKRALDYSKIKR